MLTELAPFFAAVRIAHERRQRAIESSLPPGIAVWYQRRDRALEGPVIIAGKPRADGKIPVNQDGARRWIRASSVVAKGSPPVLDEEPIR